jgi:hypothetical protein
VIDKQSRGVFDTLTAWAVIAGFALACLWFAGRQDIWIDESTQLSGLTLSPGALIRWLAGEDTGRFGVPGDRMPPLGYLLDWAWWNGVLASVYGFRLFHAAWVVVALGVFAWAGRTYLSGRAALVGLVFLAISPKTIQLAVELRAYPILFAMACVQTALFLRLIATRGAPPPRQLIVFALVSVATCFIHFFGLVAAASYFGALLLRFLRTNPVRIIVAGVATLIPTLALQPFVVGATSVSETIVAGTSPVQYLVQLFAGSAYLVVPFAGLLFLCGCLALFASGVFGGAVRTLKRRPEPVDYMIVVAALGIVATILPHFWIRTFDTLKPSYSVWLLPTLALIIASGAREMAARNAWVRRGTVAAIVALVLGALVSTAVFLVRADWYVHGPARAIAAVAGRLPADTPIVYIGRETYAYGYFPTVYRTAGHAGQWLAEEGGVRRLPDGTVQPWNTLSRYPNLIVVDIRLRRYSDLGQCLTGTCPAFDRAPELDGMLSSGPRRTATTTRTFGYYDATITRLTGS